MKKAQKNFLATSLLAPLLSMILVLMILLPMRNTQAQVPFGGLSTFVFWCNCSGNFAVYFTDLTQPTPTTLPLIYQPGATMLYSYGMVTRPGTWLLGLYQPGGQCRFYVKVGCAVVPTAGTMTMVGTSM